MISTALVVGSSSTTTTRAALALSRQSLHRAAVLTTTIRTKATATTTALIPGLFSSQRVQHLQKQQQQQFSLLYSPLRTLSSSGVLLGGAQQQQRHYHHDVFLPTPRTIQRGMSTSSNGGGGDGGPPKDKSLNASSSSSLSSSSAATANAAAEQARREVASDLFHQYAVLRGDCLTLDYENLRALLQGVGEDPNEDALHKILDVVDEDHNGVIDLTEFLDHSDYILGGNPARIILVVGGPGSGKGVLSRRLQDECYCVHLSSGDMLRNEVSRGSALGRQVQDIMKRGELVSSAIMVALMKRRMRDHPGKRVLLDGFPRSLENAHDLVTLCGRPELALHLHCDDTVLLERILGRGADLPEEDRREDDNFETALERLRTFHKYHPQTMEWLREQHVPIVNLDCSGPPETVWQQLQAIGRLMRPAVKLPATTTTPPPHTFSSPEQQQQQQQLQQLYAAAQEDSDRPFHEPDWDWPFSRKGS